MRLVHDEEARSGLADPVEDVPLRELLGGEEHEVGVAGHDGVPGVGLLAGTHRGVDRQRPGRRGVGEGVEALALVGL